MYLLKLIKKYESFSLKFVYPIIHLSIEHILLLIRSNKIWQYVEYSRSTSPFLRLCAKSG